MNTYWVSLPKARGVVIVDAIGPATAVGTAKLLGLDGKMVALALLPGNIDHMPALVKHGKNVLITSAQLAMLGYKQSQECTAAELKSVDFPPKE